MFKDSHNFYINNLNASTFDRAATGGFTLLKEAACLGAGHKLSDPYNAQKCHPGTRTAVLNDIKTWACSKDSNRSVMWMSGSVGVGKTSIAHTLCEQLYDEEKLLSSFFFTRTDAGSGRDDGNKLVPTIACHLAIAIPETKTRITELLELESEILTYPMNIQMEKLVLEPLATAYSRTTTSGDILFQNVVVIDGLDECKDPNMQSKIVSMISNISAKQRNYIKFFIASRPELEIRNAFKSAHMVSSCTRIVLNEHYNPDTDIHVYLLDQFAALKYNHTLESLSHDQNWPTSNDIQWMVNKSSGQFLYVSTVMEYLKHQRRDPRESLRAIIAADRNYHVTMKDSPYAPLDQLYIYILLAAQAGLQTPDKSVLDIFKLLLYTFKSALSEVISYISSASKPDAVVNSAALVGDIFVCSVQNIACLMGVTKSELELLVADLHSVLFIPGVFDHNVQMRFYHVSFVDFLKDSSRSGEFHISEAKAHKIIARYCFTTVFNSANQATLNLLEPAQKYALHKFFQHVKDSGFDEELLMTMRSESSQFRTVINTVVDKHYYTSLECFMRFHFIDGKPKFWFPETKNIKDICQLIVDIVDERLLEKYDLSDGSLDLEICRMIMRSKQQRVAKLTGNDIHYYWLLRLLEDPDRGKHLYLNADNSFLLYNRIIRHDKILRQSLREIKFEEWYPAVTHYLLDKAKSSKSINIDESHRLSEYDFNEILRWRGEGNDKPRQSRISTGLLKCKQYLRGDLPLMVRLHIAPPLKDVSRKLRRIFEARWREIEKYYHRTSFGNHPYQTLSEPQV